MKYTVYLPTGLTVLITADHANVGMDGESVTFVKQTGPGKDANLPPDFEMVAEFYTANIAGWKQGTDA